MYYCFLFALLLVSMHHVIQTTPQTIFEFRKHILWQVTDDETLAEKMAREISDYEPASVTHTRAARYAAQKNKRSHTAMAKIVTVSS